MIHVPHVRVVADTTTTDTRPTLPAPNAPTDPAVHHLNTLARQAVLFAATYAPGNVAARRMAESVAQELQRLAIAAGVPGGERVGASIVPLMPSTSATSATSATNNTTTPEAR